MRLQVFLSKAGISSRRKAVDIIKRGKIHINGKKVFSPSLKVDPGKDRIFLNNKRIVEREKVYIMLHKPEGVTTTKKDPFAARTVMDLLPNKYRHLNPIGRLDKDTTGLLLLSNDGELINKLTHPRYEVGKIYHVLLDRNLMNKDRAKLEKGVLLDGKNTAPCRISFRDGDLLEIGIREGRKRQIKRMFSKFGYRVIDLKRIKEGFLSLGSLPKGKWRFLTRQEVLNLKAKL